MSVIFNHRDGKGRNYISSFPKEKLLLDYNFRESFHCAIFLGSPIRLILRQEINVTFVLFHSILFTHINFDQIYMLPLQFTFSQQKLRAKISLLKRSPLDPSLPLIQRQGSILTF